MDISEKDLARQKYRQSKKHSNHNRSHGGRGRGGNEHISNDIESNSNTIEKEDVPAQQQAAITTPAQRSQGADLLQLLQESEKYDPKVAFRARCNLSSIRIDSHPPPPPPPLSTLTSTANNTLSLDLNKLALCLSMLPLSTVLDTTLLHNDDSKVGGSHETRLVEEFREQVTIENDNSDYLQKSKIDIESGDKILGDSIESNRKPLTAAIIDELRPEPEDDDELDALLGLSDEHHQSSNSSRKVGDAYESGTGDLTDFLDSL